MREIHLVALSSDGRHLVLSPTKGSVKGAYLLEISPKVRRALNGTAPRAGKAAGAKAEVAAPEPPAPPAESALTPKEIQARLRAGQTPERVAKAAGVPVQRVTRFYGPVLSERAQVIEAARAAVLTRARRGASAAPLGDAVAANLAARRIAEPPDEAWTAFRRADGTWVVRVDLAVRGRTRRAEWRWDPAARAVTAADPYAAGLAHVDEAVPRRRSAASRAAQPAAARATPPPASAASPRSSRAARGTAETPEPRPARRARGAASPARRRAGR